MRLYPELYTLEDLRLMKGGDEMGKKKTYLTYDHYYGEPRMTRCERMEYERGHHESRPVLSAEGWATIIRLIAAAVLLGLALYIADQAEASASSMSIDEALDTLWEIEQHEVEADNWDIVYENAQSGEWLVPAPASEQTPKANEFPACAKFVGADVKALQDKLHGFGYAIQRSETENQRFGPTTALAVKQFQAEHGLEPDGIVASVTLKALGLNDCPAMHYEADLDALAKRSVASFLIYISTNPTKLSGPVLSVFARTRDEKYKTEYWRLYAQYDCAIGTASNRDNITPLGAYLPTYFKDVPDSYIGGKIYYYQVGFTDELAVLSVGYDSETKEFDNWIVDHNNSVRRDSKGRLTGGSVRVAYDVAQWLYVNCDYDTYIVIDDRTYG